MIVCLDQCAISELAKCQADGGLLHQLKNSLLEAARQLKLICPVAKETLVETAGVSSAVQRRLIYDLHTELADARLGGAIWSFKDMWKIINEETLALARSARPPSAFELIRWKAIADDELAAATWSNVVERKQVMLERVRAHRLVQTEGKPVVEFTKKGAALDLQHVSHIFRQAERLLKGEPLDQSDHMGYGVAQYLQERGITRPELEKLIQDILHHRWEAIPVVFNRTQIVARLEIDSHRENTPRKYDANNEFDIPRIAVGLSAADLVITDAAMAQLCKSTKTERWTATKVFAVRDAKKILAFVRALLAEQGDYA